MDWDNGHHLPLSAIQQERASALPAKPGGWFQVFAPNGVLFAHAAPNKGPGCLAVGSLRALSYLSSPTRGRRAGRKQRWAEHPNGTGGFRDPSRREERDVRKIAPHAVRRSHVPTLARLNMQKYPGQLMRKARHPAMSKPWSLDPPPAVDLRISLSIASS